MQVQGSPAVRKLSQCATTHFGTQKRYQIEVMKNLLKALCVGAAVISMSLAHADQCPNSKAKAVTYTQPVQTHVNMAEKEAMMAKKAMAEKEAMMKKEAMMAKETMQQKETVKLQVTGMK